MIFSVNGGKGPCPWRGCWPLWLASLLIGSCGCGEKPVVLPASWPPPSSLSGARALDEAARFVELGPRVSGTDGARKAADYLVNRLGELGLDVRLEPFEESTPDGPVTFRNVVARLPGANPDTIILMSHYDTKSGIPGTFVGANDSGSSTGLLLELARVLREKRGGPAVEFLFTDGEECKVSYGPNDGLHGSRHHATRLKAGGGGRIRAVILLDMIGDRDLKVSIPRNVDPTLALAVFKAAEEEGVRHRFALGDGAVLDDHVPFLEAGFPAVDLIDFAYGENGDNRYWHTAGDTMDKLSSESLEIVGRVVLRLLPAL